MNLLIKSQMLYQLSYWPAQTESPLRPQDPDCQVIRQQLRSRQKHFTSVQFSIFNQRDRLEKVDPTAEANCKIREVSGGDGLPHRPSAPPCTRCPRQRDPSDSTSRWTHVRPASASPCRVRRGLAPSSGRALPGAPPKKTPAEGEGCYYIRRSIRTRTQVQNRITFSDKRPSKQPQCDGFQRDQRQWCYRPLAESGRIQQRSNGQQTCRSS